MNARAIGIFFLAPTSFRPKAAQVFGEALTYVHACLSTRMSPIDLQTISDIRLDLSPERSGSGCHLLSTLDGQMIRLSLGIALGLNVTLPCNAQEILDADQLSTMAAPVMNFRSKDQFDTPADPPSLNGKRFSYVVTPSKVDHGCEALAGWYYDQGKQTFVGTSGYGMLSENSLNKDTPKMEFPKKHSYAALSIRYFGVSCDRSKVSTYWASNGFGVQIEIKKYSNRSVGIGFGTTELYDYLKGWDRDPYFQLAVVGDEARQLAENFRIRLSGTLGIWPNGRTLICAKSGSGPTRDNPIDRSEDICLFNGQVEKIEYIDARTGAVLATVNAKIPKRR